MFSRLRQWISGWFQKPDDFSIYRPAERQIFSYFDGRRMIRADPMALHQSIMDVWTDLSIDLKMSNGPWKEAIDARRKATEKLQKIFGVVALEPDLNGTGLTFFELVELLGRYWEFCNALKKKSDRSTTNSTATWSATDVSPANESSPTSSTSAGGSADTASTGDSSTPSPPESESPSV